MGQAFEPLFSTHADADSDMYSRHIRKPAFVRMGRAVAAIDDSYDAYSDGDMPAPMIKRKPGFVRMGKRSYDDGMSCLFCML